MNAAPTSNAVWRHILRDWSCKIKSHRVPSAKAKIDRNREIAARAEAGESVCSLARAYALSRIRIQQILDEYPRTASVRMAVNRAPQHVDANTELKTLPISARLSRACDIQAIRTVGDLGGAAEALRHLYNVGDRTMLEVQEILNEAGLSQMTAAPVVDRRVEVRHTLQGKRAMLHALLRR